MIKEAFLSRKPTESDELYQYCPRESYFLKSIKDFVFLELRVLLPDDCVIDIPYYKGVCHLISGICVWFL